MKALQKSITHLVAIWGLLLVASCQSGPDYKRGHDFSRYHTFAIMPLPTQGTYQDPAIAVRLGRPAREAIVETLSAKGFKEVPEAEADLLVKLRYDYLPEGERAETRMLDIQMIDARSHETVWSTWMRRTTSATLGTEAFRKAVAEKLEPFPSANRSAAAQK